MRTVVFLSLLLSMNCGQGTQTESRQAILPLEPSVETCDSCGMVVQEQPTPRCQLQHRDGKRAFFCSPGDLLVYLAAPSPHGPVDALFIEAVQLEVSGDEWRVTAEKWLPAQDLFYVKGISRPGVMGEPILGFASAAAAATALQIAGATGPHRWAELSKKQ